MLQYKQYLCQNKKPLKFNWIQLIIFRNVVGLILKVSKKIQNKRQDFFSGDKLAEIYIRIQLHIRNFTQHFFYLNCREILTI
jgi:hypothetical protein